MPGLPSVLEPLALLGGCCSSGSEDLYSPDDEIFQPGGWTLARTPDDTEASSGDDAAPLCAVFGWAEVEDPRGDASSDDEDGARARGAKHRPCA